MPISILAIGKKHDAQLAELINDYEKRLRTPWRPDWRLISSSSHEGSAAIDEESERILGALRAEQHVILLDERGSVLDTPSLSRLLVGQIGISKDVVFVIGGAFGVNDNVRSRADLVLSLSKLVFPHQLVRLILSEQIYRCWTIEHGLKYHHL